MLRIVQGSGGASGAARYYTEGLKQADYYIKGEAIEGRWHGLVLENLGLTGGDVETAEQFSALLNNRHPITGKKLTPRMNKGDNRTVGWDMTFSVPKSVSILHAITRDPEIVRVFRESVAATMIELEKRIETRVRVGGKNENRVVGNAVWCEFLHSTTRPLSDGVPDCHLHIHAYLQNLCFDEVEGKFKAINLRSIKDQAYYFQSLHDSILAGKLAEIGYPVTKTAKGWELAALSSRDLIDKYSRRTTEIDKLASELGISDPKVKEKLGATTRKRKDKNLSLDELMKAWKSRLTADEAEAIQRAYRREDLPPVKRVTVEEALDYSEAKNFQRESVVVRERIISSALEFGAGAVAPSDIQREMERRGYIERRIGNEVQVTTPAQVIEEITLIQKARAGLGKHAPLIKGRLKFTLDFLSQEQRAAVRLILKSHSQVIGLRGRAGTGKSTLLREVREQLALEGIRMVALAPSAQASRGVLRESGFVGAETVARFLVDKELQKKARGQVLLIDEAGTISTKELTQLLQLAGESTRVILSGDTGQHSPQGRGDAMRLLESLSGIPIANVHHIIRQKEVGYLKAVEAIADGRFNDAFATLNEIGAIRVYKNDGERYRALAEKYAQYLAETGIEPLVVSPTHQEGQLAVDAVRVHLRELGKLGAERGYSQLRDVRWEDLEKTRGVNYSAGQWIQFHQNVPGIRRGSIVPVLEVDEANKVWIEDPTGKRMELDLSRSHHFRVFETEDIRFAPGDRIKLTNGGRDLNGRRIENGMLSTVKAIDREGRIALSNGIELDGEFRHWAHGYDTSVASQGKSKRDVLVAQSCMSSGAASKEQLYVSLSRGEMRLQVFTDDMSVLTKAAMKSSRRLSALEFTELDEEILMKGGLTGKKWTERIAERKESQGKDFKMYLDKLLTERKPKLQDGEKKNFYQNMLDMQRSKKGADGKSRSKGQPNLEKPKHKEKVGTIDPRRSGLEKDVKAKSESVSQQEAKAEKKQKGKKSVSGKAGKSAKKKDSLIKHVEKEVKAGEQHLNEVVGRSKRGTEAIKAAGKRSIKFGNHETTLEKLANNPKTKEAQIKDQATKKSPVLKPQAAPVIRRGR